MLAYLADPANTCGTPWWNTFAGPIGVVFGALITGVVTLRNARKSVYERLESLITIRKEWPTELAGGDTVDHSIAIALAEIRQKGPGHAPQAVTKPQREADQEVRTTQRRQNLAVMFGVITVIVGLAVPLLNSATGSDHGAQPTGGAVDWLPVALTVGATGIAGLVTFLAARR